jgi:ferredoxin
MIIAERKPFEELAAMIAPYGRVLVLGCGGCVTVCCAGGEKETGLLAEQLRLHAKTHGLQQVFFEETLTRQCDPEYLEEIKTPLTDIDAILSLACGVGVNYLTDRITERRVVVLPAVNTTHMGATEEQGVWAEKCAGCGDCILHLTGGICPVARCAKTISNGPCGGSNKGKCEINPDTDCAWAKIVERMEELGRLGELEQIREPRDWSKSRHGGPRKTVREDLRGVQEESKK